MSECVCDYDGPEIYFSELRKARKVHVCEECRARIQPGEQYENASGKWDGRFDQFKTCSRCIALRDWVKAHVPCFCWAHGHMNEDSIETADHFSREAPGLLFGAYRRLVACRRGYLGSIGR